MDKQFLNKILNEAQKLNASDIHLSSNLHPYVRLQGDIDGQKLRLCYLYR